MTGSTPPTRVKSNESNGLLSISSNKLQGRVSLNSPMMPQTQFIEKRLNPPSESYTIIAKTEPPLHVSKIPPTIGNTHKNQHETLAKVAPPKDERIQLLPRIAECRLRNWISEEDEEYFITLLQKAASDNAASYVQKQLDAIERKARSEKSVDYFQPSHTDHRSYPKSSIKKNEELVARNMSKEVVQIIDVSVCSKLGIDYNLVSHLFVEMCFFARLGFLQPPCCLKCSFVNSVLSQKTGDQHRRTTAPHCHRYTIWREDCTVPLSRNTLSGNLLLIRCSDAQKLILGDEVISTDQVWRWDFSKQRITRTNKN